MIKSMTGFASLTHEDERATIGVTVRAVNHRFLDVQLRQANVPTVELNEEFANALTAALDRARERGLVIGQLTPGDLLRMPQAITVRERGRETQPEVEAQLAASVEAAVEQALADLDAMRMREGGHLRVDLNARKLLLAELIERLAGAAAEGRVTLESRLTERAREISTQLPVDQAMLAQEIVRTAQRSDVSEEVSRFRGHILHWDALAESDEPCGRKLDFLLQEMNREVNTLGAKADGLRVSEIIIAAKAELEKMREQVQNVE